MSQNTAQPDAHVDSPRNGKRRPVVALALAALAVGGVGAALTSAAWSDNVFFSAQADGAEFDLRGSFDGAAWVQSDDKDAIELVVPADAFAKLIPGESREVTLYVKNDGNVDAAVISSVEWATGSTFTTVPTASITGLASTLTPAGTTGDTDAFTLTVTAPDDWDVANQGKTGTLVVTISGEATS